MEKRLALAGLVAIVAALLAAGLWVVGQARYLEDFCQTRAPQPQPRTPETISGRPAYLDGLTTIRCQYDGLPDVVVTDALPLAGAILLGAVALVVAAVALRWARRPIS